MFPWVKSKVTEVFKKTDHGCSTDCQKQLRPLRGIPKLVKRKRPLTPTPSNDVQAQQQTCLFFTKLPLEIRRLILVQAFGERTLHMDFHDYHNREPGSGFRSDLMIRAQTEHTLPVVGGCGPSQHLGRAYHPTDNDEFQWFWWSSDCHRNPPHKLHGSMGARDDQSRAPWDDDCLHGEARFCTDWGRPGWDCVVGATGFLKSCRQAYVEGLDVLYKTNTIHIANSTMFPRLPRLIIPDRLADVVSLEVVWNHHELRSSLWGRPRPAQMPQYLHVLSDHLTGLVKIFISVVKVINRQHADFNEDVLEPLDEFVRSTPRLREVCLSVPWWSFSNTIVAAVEPTPQAVLDTASGEKFPPLHVWRPLSDRHIAVEVAGSPYPDAPAGTPKHLENGGLAGYWIVEGHDRDGERDVLIDDPM